MLSVKKSSLHFVCFEFLWKFKSEQLEQYGLVFVRLCYTTFSDFNASFGWQYDIDQTDLLEFGEYFSRFVTQPHLTA